MWDLLGPGLEPVSPALAGGFLTTAPPGKPQNLIFKKREKLEHLQESLLLDGLCRYSKISFLLNGLGES